MHTDPDITLLASPQVILASFYPIAPAKRHWSFISNMQIDKAIKLNICGRDVRL